MRILYEAVTIAGRVRSENQDNFYVNGSIKKMTEAECMLSGVSEKNHQVFAVCDGMGGEDSGEVAAAMAVRILQSYASESVGINWPDYIKEVNQRLCEYQRKHSIQMGTTLAGISIDSSKLIAVNVGDSRIYQIHNKEIKQLSKDHSEYQFLLDAGIKADERAMRRAKSCLTQCLGLPEEELELEPHVVNIAELAAGDYYLICSDGLHGTLSEEQINRIISDHKIIEDNICEILVKEAEKQGSRDNITALLICISEDVKPVSETGRADEISKENTEKSITKENGLRRILGKIKKFITVW